MRSVGRVSVHGSILTMASNSWGKKNVINPFFLSLLIHVMTYKS
jgi:hypothetical protein